MPLPGFGDDEVGAEDFGAVVVDDVALFGGVEQPVKSKPQATATDTTAAFDFLDIATAMCRSIS